MQDLTSDRIIEFLDLHPPSNTAELSGALLLTKADIRYHLNHLEKIGLVTKSIRYNQRGAGRPGYFYALSSNDPVSGYRLLARVCMGILFNEKVDVQPDIVIRRIVEEISRELTDDTSQGTQRLGAAVQYLIKLGYQATWEARPDHPILMLRNCPYLDLALDHPELCQIDKLLVEKLTGWKCEQKQRIRDDIHTIAACRFSLTAAS